MTPSETQETQLSLNSGASKKRIPIRTACAVKLLALVLLLTPPVVVQAQFTFVTNTGALTITGYTGPGGAVIIPDTTNGLPVTSIGSGAFGYSTSLTSVTIPDSVTNIGDSAFQLCTSLTSITIGTNVTSIGSASFSPCISLTAITVDALNPFYSSLGGVLFNKSQTTLIQYPGGKAGSYTVPNSVTNIGDYAFQFSINLTSVTLGPNVTSIGGFAFYFCTSLTGVYFQGNTPSLGNSYVFYGDNNATVHYLPGTTGWQNFAQSTSLPTVLWQPQIQTSDASFGVRSNQFGFNINWASGITVVVEASTNLANPVWSLLQTNTLTGSSSYFSDPQWTNYSARFYRLHWP